MVTDSPHADRFATFFQERRVCVTGGAGFIGGHLVEALVRFGGAVRVIDDLSNSTGEHLLALVDQRQSQVDFVYGSILDPDALADAVRGADIVFHLAALGSVPRSFEEPERTMDVNAIGTLRVAQAAAAAGASRWVYSASSSAYGNNTALPKVETLLPEPMSPYAASKLMGEHIVHAWAHGFGLEGVSLRYFNIFGPRQPADSAYSAVIAAFARKLAVGSPDDPAIIYGDGHQSRDFTPVENAVHANLLAATTRTRMAGQVVNVGCGEQTSVLALYRRMAQLMGREGMQPRMVEERAGDVRHSVADLSRASDLLDYQPVVSFDDGLRALVGEVQNAHRR
ncbi:MAG: NAD-dependent epimerase/dehydratase family protein [Phycisphaerales bacterium]|nr:NAD-dependent epimerase/dehydratase family protein [Phycisphaerales bacterium]